MQTGAVFWITGLAGSGKSSVARQLSHILTHEHIWHVSLDGDRLRALLPENLDYSLEERKKLATHYSKLCHLLSSQGLVVICSCMALFHHIHAWNRKNIPNYFEIFLDVPMEELLKRDQKKLYTRALSGKIKNVMGVDIEPEFPKNPNCTIKNYQDISVSSAAQIIYDQFNKVYTNCLFNSLLSPE